MKKTIINNGITYGYDIQELIKRINLYKWEVPYGNEYTDKSWMTPTQKDFDILKQKFISEIENLDKNIDELLNTKVILTAKKLLHKSKNYVIIDSNICTKYEDYHGSHNYRNLCLCLNKLSDNKADLTIREINFNSPF